MRVLIPSIVAVLSLTGCVAHRPVSPQADRPGYSSDTFERKVEAMNALEGEADVVLEAEHVDRFRLLKPWAVVAPAATTIDGHSRIIPTRTPSGSGLLVLIVPESQIFDGTDKIMDEVILDVRDVAMSRGYPRFVVGAHSFGSVIQIHTDELPSREQVAEMKRLLNGAAAKMEHTK